MPQSKEETFLKGKDTTNTNFDHDISYSDPSAASKTSEPHDRKCLIASEPPIDRTKKNNKASFLTLPVEIRLLIYNLFLIMCSSDLGDGRRYTQPLEPGDRWLSRDERQKYSLKPSMGTGILQTCKQIYHEANPVFYSKNRFLFYDPEKALRFIEQIGPVNLKLITTLDIHVNHTKGFGVDTTAESPIVRVLDILADEGNGIWVVEYYWTYLTDDGKVRKYYLKESSRRHATLNIRTLEKIRFQEGNWAIVNIKFRGNIGDAVIGS
jgi:hypothetical protein